MSTVDTFRSTEHTRHAVDELATFAADLQYDAAPVAVQDRLTPMLVDLFGAVVAGMRTPEMRALVGSWQPPAGDVPVPGTRTLTTPHESAYLQAVAACVLELDEGNKHAAGHPAAHVVFAALASACASEREISGEEVLTAVMAGYEVAARFGRATRRHPPWHTHGHWGVTGAATASALLGGCDQRQIAAAIDASTGLMHVTPWATVLSGSFTRNLWMAGANVAGLHAARLAKADLVSNSGQALHSLGDIVGELDIASLTDRLGEDWLLTGGYLKRHASCAYTHAAVDVVQSLRFAVGWDPASVQHVSVRIHSLAEPLLGRHPDSRLAAMFSLPFVVANAVVNGTVDPSTMEPGSSAFRAAEEFSDRVDVEISAELDAELPSRRCTEVTVELADGTTLALGQPNPIGDADHFPLDGAEVRTKLVALVGAETAAGLWKCVAALPRAGSVRDVLTDLARAADESAAP